MNIKKTVDKDKPILAYKGFEKVHSAKGTCRGHEFETGKKYSVPLKDGKQIATCSYGFHACEKPADVLKFYSYIASQPKIYAKVKLWGQVHIDIEKIAAEHIEVLKFISVSEFKEIVAKQKIKDVKKHALQKIKNKLYWEKQKAKAKILAERAKIIVNNKSVASVAKTYYSHKTTLVNNQANAYIVIKDIRHAVSKGKNSIIIGNFRSFEGVSGCKFIFTNGRIVTVGKDGIKANTRYVLSKGKLTQKAA